MARLSTLSPRSLLQISGRALVDVEQHGGRCSHGSCLGPLPCEAAAAGAQGQAQGPQGPATLFPNELYLDTGALSSESNVAMATMLTNTTAPTSEQLLLAMQNPGYAQGGQQGDEVGAREREQAAAQQQPGAIASGPLVKLQQQGPEGQQQLQGADAPSGQPFNKQQATLDLDTIQLSEALATGGLHGLRRMGLDGCQGLGAWGWTCRVGRERVATKRWQGGD